jgi:NADPH2:quinone reductase
MRYEEVPDPVPGFGEVLVRVEAIAIEGGDLMLRSMRRDDVRPAGAGALSSDPALQCVGYSAAGEVVALGEGVSGIRAGTRVATFGHAGSHAELRAVRSEHCWPLPTGFDAASAACVPVAFGTAYEALFEFGHLRSGQTVFVQGAAGGVALAGVQLAHRAGARVIGTCSNSTQLAALAEHGLDDGINHRDDDFLQRVLELTGGAGADLSLDPVGGEKINAVLKATRPGGRVAIVGASSRERSSMDATLLVLRSLTMHGFMLSARYGDPRVREYIGELIGRIAEGDLHVVIDRVFPLAQAAEAHRHAEMHGRVGRVVMVP